MSTDLIKRVTKCAEGSDRSAGFNKTIYNQEIDDNLCDKQSGC